MALHSVTLYSTDTYCSTLTDTYSGTSCDKTNLLFFGSADLQSVTFNTYMADPFIVDEGELTDGAGGYKNDSILYRRTYSLSSEVKTGADFATFQNQLLAVFKKHYKYFECTDYGISLHDTGRVIPVAKDGFEAEIVTNGNYRYNIDLIHFETA